MKFKTYKKRDGTSDRGKDYEQLLCGLYTLKFASSPDVYDFEISTNNAFFGDLDDVALRVKYTDGSIKVFLLQLKHSEKKKTLTLSGLASENGDFGLFKYLKSPLIYLNNFHFILYTNRSGNFKDNTILPTKLEKITIKQHSCVGNNLLNTTTNRNCSVFKFESPLEFLRHFYLYVNQQNDFQIKQLIADILKTKWQCDVYTTFTEFIRFWWSGNFILTKNDVITKLAELVFSPMIKTLTHEYYNEKTKLIVEAVMESDITILNGTHNDTIGKIWRFSTIDIKQVSLAALKYGLTTKGVSKMDELSPEKQTKVLWYMGMVPLVIQMDETRKDQVYTSIKFLKFCKMKLVLVGNIPEDDFTNWKVFRNLASVPPVNNLYSRMVSALSCQLQGKQSVTLMEIGAYNSPISPFFKVSQLLEIATSDGFNIGETLAVLPTIYIKRKIPKILCSFKVIDGLTESIILLSCRGQLPTVQNKFKKRVVKVTCSSEMVENFSKHFIYGSEDEFKRDEISDLLSRKVPVHHFRVVDGSNVQWLESNRKIKEIEKYREESTEFVDDSEIDNHYHNKIKILTSHTGNGKTTLLNKIKNQALPNHFVIKMNLREHSEFFKTTKKTHREIWDYIVMSVGENQGYSDFELAVLRHFDKNRVILLWDGFDELHQSSKQVFIESVEKLHLVGLIQWISSKNHFREFLENTFNVFAINILPFCQNEQLHYIKERSGIIAQNTMADFFKNINIIDDFGYLGVPLQLYILTDIFNQNPESLDTILTLSDMCGSFIDGKFTHYLKKTSLNLDFLEDFIENSKLHRLEQYKIAALKTFLPEFFPSLKNSEKFVNEVKSGDFLGLIMKINQDGSANFEHNIFGEYLTALWLSENLDFRMENFIFEEKFRNIRFMFDLLLAEKQSIFINILYNKFGDLDDFGVKDKGGRTPLHLICSYGERHPLLNTQILQNKCLVEAERSTVVRDDANERIRAVKILKMKCDPLERDLLFKWTVFDYADRSLSLGLIEILGGDLPNILPNLHNYKDHATVAYYLTKMNYSNLFDAINQIPYVEDGTGGTLLHVAAEFDREKFLTCLLEEINHLKAINKSNKENWAPIHVATFHGNFGILKCLRSKKSTFPLRDPSVLSLSITHGYGDIIEFLLKDNNVSPNEFYHFNHFTQSLPIAIINGRLDLVVIMVENGAKLEKIGKNSMNALQIALENEKFEIAEYLLTKGLNIDAVDFTRRSSYHHAAMDNHPDVIEFLLKKNANFLGLDKSGRTPLHYAAQNGSLEVVEILIREGVEMTVPDREGYTPLHLAVYYGQVPIVTMLLAHKVEVNSPNRYGRTPLHYAAIYGLVDCVEILWKAGADLEYRDGLYGRTPLHYASWKGHEDCVDFLLKKGANVNASCNFEYTPLHLALDEANPEVCHLLVKNGANIHALNRHKISPIQRARSTTITLILLQKNPKPLHEAVMSSGFETVYELLQQGCDVNEVDGNGATALHLAAAGNDVSIAKLLINQGGSVKAKDRDGYIPLHYAVQGDSPSVEMVKVLLQSDDDNSTINARTNTGLTPLHITAQKFCFYNFQLSEFEGLVKFLLENGAQIDGTDDYGYTPLHYATQGGNLQVVQLLTHPSLINKPNKNQRTPLHIVSTKGYIQIVKFLLTQGASVKNFDIDGDTPIDDAFNAEHPEIYKILTSDNCRSINATNKKGRTLLHLAVKNNSKNLVQFCLSEKASVDVTDNDGNTPLDLALYHKNFDLFKELLPSSTKFDVNQRNECYKCYPLHLAIRGKKSTGLVALFLEKGARVDVADNDGNTPFHLILPDNDEEYLEMLLSHDRDSVAIAMVNKRGQNVLHLVAEDGKDHLVKSFINKGVSMDVVDQNGNTPFDLAFNMEHISAMELLLDTKNINLEKRNKKQSVLFNLMVNYGSIETVQWMIDHGASINAIDGRGNTPLHIACSAPFGNKPQLLIDHYKSTIEIDKPNNKGETCLHHAATYSLDLVKSLIQLGFSPSVTTNKGETPLFYALERENISTFKFLLPLTPEVDIRTMIKWNGRTCLHMAASKGDLDLVKLSLGKGLLVNEVDKMGHTPVYNAIENNHLKVLKVLLDHDVNSMVINSCDRNGSTFLHTAVMCENFQLVKLLVEKGAWIEVFDENGKTPIDIALEREQHQIHQFLVDKIKFPAKTGR